MTGAHSTDRKMRAWARALVVDNPELAALDLATAVAGRVAAAFESPTIDEVHRLTVDAVGRPPGGWANPWLPGIVHEQAVTPERRTKRGAWYTPKSVVDGLVRLAMPAGRPLPEFIADPTCGGGAFLLSALDHLVASGVKPEKAIRSVAGQDIDPDAVEVTRLALETWAAAHGLYQVDVSVTLGDALAGYPANWPTLGLIIGNPPFASPLRSGAVSTTVAEFRLERQELLGPYADVAAIHLLAALERSDPGSVIALVQPQSILSGRDTRALREHCASVAPVQAMWAAREAVFDAGVRACAVVLTCGAEPPESIVLASGPEVSIDDRDMTNGSTRASSWSGLAATALGAPPLPRSLLAGEETDSRLGELVTATAGFRDEYYGLVSACREWDGASGDEPNQLVTVGAVEPLATFWGSDAIKFGRRLWQKPTVDLDALDAKVRTWTERQMVPKVVLATQSRILEPVVDRTGLLIPATPLLAVHTEPESLDLVAAVLLAPPVVAWAWQQWFGAALAVDAVKLAAKQVGQLPLPDDREAWAEAAAMIAAGSAKSSDIDQAWVLSCSVANLMNRAYGADASVYEWWLTRSRRPRPTGIAVGHSG